MTAAVLSKNITCRVLVYSQKLLLWENCASKSGTVKPLVLSSNMSGSNVSDIFIHFYMGDFLGSEEMNANCRNT